MIYMFVTHEAAVRGANERQTANISKPVMHIEYIPIV